MTCCLWADLIGRDELGVAAMAVYGVCPTWFGLLFPFGSWANVILMTESYSIVWRFSESMSVSCH